MLIIGKAGHRMSKEVSFKNRDRFVQLGIAIAALRKMRGLSQEKLAERAGVSRSLISTIEPADLINASVFSDRILKSK